ncbi:MAG TPA: type I-U CRISPR-associated RAMP protein Csb1/Cas7u [Gaiellaceae bacterium]|nr:type I-U CRISPR-associated RAMP protein Csb1/Cas7u [Gaiellaceae bacterium]
MTAAALLDQLDDARYLALDFELVPLGSPTFQPTTFANTGPSFYEAPDGQLAAVVDSVASMANQLELTIWDEASCQPAEAIAPLPWVQVVDADGAYYTSSRTAAHRLNAASLMNAIVTADGEVFGSRIKRLLQDAKPPVHRRLAEVVWQHDPLSIIHGCWFPDVWDGRARLTRALAARIDALGVQSQSAQVGGQKTRDALDEPGSVEDTGYRTVRGEAPYHTSEVSASRIVAPAVLDLALLRSYGLPAEAQRALVATAVLQIVELAAAWPRRRSRCILCPRDVHVRMPEGWALPELEELQAECLDRCREATGTDSAAPLVVRYEEPPKAKKTKKSSTGDGS